MYVCLFTIWVTGYEQWHRNFIMGWWLISINEVKLRRARSVPGWVMCPGSIPGAGHLISVCYQPPRPTQPSIPPGLVNEDQLRLQLWLRRKRQVWFIQLADGPKKAPHLADFTFTT